VCVHTQITQFIDRIARQRHGFEVGRSQRDSHETGRSDADGVVVARENTQATSEELREPSL